VKGTGFSEKGTGFSEKGTGFSPYIEANRSDRVLTPEGTLPVEQALHLTRQIAEGLGAAHAKGMVHRDIKPENILMAREGGAWLPKIADFGIVATKENSSVFTRTGGTLLTMTYAAPEQWRGTPAAELDGRTDLYALGGLLYEMLTGQTPFHAESYEGWARHHQTTPPPPPSALRPDLANWQGLDALVLRLLAKGREDRPKDVAELLRLLDTLRYFPPDARRETVREVAQERTDRKRRRSKLIRVLAISALMFLMAFAVWITYQRTRKPKAVDYEALAKKYGGVLVQPPQPPSQQQIRGGKIATFNLSDIDRPHNVDSSNNWDESHGNASTQKANVQVGGKTVIVPVEKPTDPMHPPGGVPKPSIPESEVSEETNSVSELTWTDKVTGLMWTRKDGSRDVTWFQAVDFCGHLQLGGYSDWRLPTIDELQGIYDQNVNIQGQWGKENSIVMHIKGNLQLSGWLWSSSLQVDSNRAWFSDFHRGLWVPSRLNESNNGRALCVRQVEK
jgi:serine/threonine protein kinase